MAEAVLKASTFSVAASRRPTSRCRAAHVFLCITAPLVSSAVPRCVLVLCLPLLCVRPSCNGYFLLILTLSALCFLWLWFCDRNTVTFYWNTEAFVLLLNFAEV
ncbi:uncharacterized protein DS421_14g470800 [Arachis hypogaea]|nr:uncharacterized protein DS421_14g470800 [Arachis hypogaea]